MQFNTHENHKALIQIKEYFDFWLNGKFGEFALITLLLKKG